MTIVSTTNLRNNLSEVIKKVKKKDFVLVTHRGKIKTALIDIDVLEDLLSMHNKEYLESIKRAKEQYKRGEFYTMEEVFGKL